jgi:hypothetical protein
MLESTYHVGSVRARHSCRAAVHCRKTGQPPHQVGSMLSYSWATPQKVGSTVRCRTQWATLHEVGNVALPGLAGTLVCDRLLGITNKKQQTALDESVARPWLMTTADRAQ